MCNTDIVKLRERLKNFHPKYSLFRTSSKSGKEVPSPFALRLLNKDSELMKEINKFAGRTLSEKIYRIFIDNNDHFCSVCGKKTSFAFYEKGYNTFCSSKCYNISKMNSNKIRYKVEDIPEDEEEFKMFLHKVLYPTGEGKDKRISKAFVNKIVKPKGDEFYIELRRRLLPYHGFSAVEKAFSVFYDEGYCKHCGKRECTFINFGQRYKTYCGYKCYREAEEPKKKRTETCLKNLGYPSSVEAYRKVYKEKRHEEQVNNKQFFSEIEELEKMYKDGNKNDDYLY